MNENINDSMAFRKNRIAISLVGVIGAALIYAVLLSRILVKIIPESSVVTTSLGAASLGVAIFSVSFIASMIAYLNDHNKVLEKVINISGVLLVDSYIMIGGMLLAYFAVFGEQICLIVSSSVSLLLFMGICIWYMFDRTRSILVS